MLSNYNYHYYCHLKCSPTTIQHNKIKSARKVEASIKNYHAKKQEPFTWDFYKIEEL